MRSTFRRSSPAPCLDLETIRDTLAYMRDDVADKPGYAKLAAAFTDVLRELDALGAAKTIESAAPSPIRFIPFRR